MEQYLAPSGGVHSVRTNTVICTIYFISAAGYTIEELIIADVLTPEAPETPGTSMGNW